MIRTLAVASLLLLPLTALANEPQCTFNEARDLKLDLAGAKAVVFEVNQHDLVLQAGPGAAQLGGRACASNADWLRELTVTQQKVGDKLVVRLQRDARNTLTISGSSYAYLDMRGTVPDSILVQLKVGSGDVILDGAGALNLLSVGSGDFKARNIRGDAKVGTIGSGDFELDTVGGNVEIGVVGSGDTDVRKAKGNVRVGTVGSGDTDLRDIGGSVTVVRDGSGDVTARDVGGDLRVANSGSGDIRHSNVRGRVELPRGK